MKAVKTKFGTLYGIFIPNVSMMLGVILFLRLGLLTANIGIISMTAIILLALLLMLITSLSIGAIASNMQVGIGGLYYLISRTLGIELGGAIGISIFLAQILTISLTISGFAIIVHQVYPTLPITAIELASLFILAIIAVNSSKLIMHMQFLVLIIMLASIIIVMQGDVSNISADTIYKPYFSERLNFWEAFAIFFPAMTGIEAGMALSGNLKNPARSLFIGNIYSLITVSVIYLIVIFFSVKYIPYNLLESSPFAFVEFSGPKSFIYLGIMVAAISSTMGSIVSAPIILQIMAEDGALPLLLAKKTQNGEPKNAILLTVIISAVIITITKIDHVIPILSMICLITYGLMNFIAAINSYINMVSWRPIYKVSYIISAIGVLLALVIMLMVSAKYSLIAICIVCMLMIYFSKKNIAYKFPDLRDSLIFFLIRQFIYQLDQNREKAVTWHPVVMLLAVSPSRHEFLSSICHKFTIRNGILIFSSVIPEYMVHQNRLESLRAGIYGFIEDHNYKGLVEVNQAKNTHDGFLNYIKAYGFGSIYPNLVVLPVDHQDFVLDEVLECLKAAFLHKKNILYSCIDESSFDINNKLSSIALWWNSDAAESFFLLLNLAMLIINSCEIKTLNLNAIVYDEKAKEGLSDYLHQFVLEKRIPFSINIYLEEETIDFISAINKYAVDTDIILMPVELPSLDENYELIEQYKDYLGQCLIKVNNNKTLIGCCMDALDHSQIYPEVL